MKRRSFLLGALASPVIVSAQNIWVPPRRLIDPRQSVKDALVYQVQENFDGYVIPKQFAQVARDSANVMSRVLLRSGGWSEWEIEEDVTLTITPAKRLKIKL